MNQEQRIVTDLLRASIWDSPADTSQWPAKVDWDKVYEAAHQQAVLGLFNDALLSLPEDRIPARDFRIARLTELASSAQEQAYQKSILVELVRKFQASGIKVLLMKGLSLAPFYPHPQYRLSGDIDLYTGPEQYEKACQLILTWCENANVIEEEKDEKHVAVNYKGVEVEIHRITESFSIKESNEIGRAHV